MIGPNPDTLHPIKEHTNIVFLKNQIKAKNIFVGDYTYYDARWNGGEPFESFNVLYNYEFSQVKLVIGKFCAIAAKTRFIMTGDHKLDGVSTFPFPIFQQGWEAAFDASEWPVKGDTVVGNDVWFGYDCVIRSGVKIGNGAVIATRAVVVKDVPPYSIVGGNPAKVIKMRFDDKTIERLQQIAWWDWNIEKINRNLGLITHLDIDRLEMAKTF